MFLRSRLFIVLAFVLLIPGIAFATGPWIIDGVRFEVEGRSRPVSLERIVKIKAGQTYYDKSSLESALEREVKDLINLRVFADVDARLVELDSEPHEPHRVLVVFSIKDGWGIIPIFAPIVEGDLISVELGLADVNFLGTLTTMSVSGDVTLKTIPKSPLEMARWNITLYWAGLGGKRWNFSAYGSQGYRTQWSKDSNGSVRLDYSFHRTYLQFSAVYEFPRLRGLFWTITPGFLVKYHYRGKVPGEREEVLGLLSQSLEWRRVDWVDFYRMGWSVGLNNTTWGGGIPDPVELKTDFLLDGTVHFVAGQVNPSFKTRVYLSFNYVATLGSFLRGVRNERLSGDWGIFFNTQMQVKILSFRLFELHVQPFLDMGFAGHREEKFQWSRNFRAGVGSEFLVFFPSSPAFMIRAYAGVDLTIGDWSTFPEWLELGLQYTHHF